MLPSRSVTKIPAKPLPRISWREIGAFIAEAIGAASICASGYLLLLLGYGFGLN